MKSLATDLQQEIESLKESQKSMTDTLKGFDTKYGLISQNMESFKRNMQEQDALMSSIMTFASEKSIKKKKCKHIYLLLLLLFRT